MVFHLTDGSTPSLCVSRLVGVGTAARQGTDFCTENPLWGIPEPAGGRGVAVVVASARAALGSKHPGSLRGACGFLWALGFSPSKWEHLCFFLIKAFQTLRR